MHIYICMYTFTIYTIYIEPDTEGRGGGWTLDALSLAKLVQSGRDVSVQHGVRWRLVAQQTLQVSLHICRVHVRKETYKETYKCHTRFVTHRWWCSRRCRFLCIYVGYICEKRPTKRPIEILYAIYRTEIVAQQTLQVSLHVYRPRL